MACYEINILDLFFFTINFSANAGPDGGQAYDDAADGGTTLTLALDGRGCK